jgi:hypothetical protein
MQQMKNINIRLMHAAIYCYLSLITSTASAASDLREAICTVGKVGCQVIETPKAADYNRSNNSFSAWNDWSSREWKSASDFCNRPKNLNAQFYSAANKAIHADPVSCLVVRSLIDGCKKKQKLFGLVKYTADMPYYCFSAIYEEGEDSNNDDSSAANSSSNCTYDMYLAWAKDLRKKTSSLTFTSKETFSADVATLALYQATHMWPSYRPMLSGTLQEPNSRLSCTESKDLRNLKALVMGLAVAEHNQSRSGWVKGRITIRMVTDVLLKPPVSNHLPDLMSRVIVGKFDPATQILSLDNRPLLEKAFSKAISNGSDKMIELYAASSRVGSPQGPEEPGVYSVFFNDGVTKSTVPEFIEEMTSIDKIYQYHAIQYNVY